jgi:hypothetical protein
VQRSGIALARDVEDFRWVNGLGHRAAGRLWEIEVTKCSFWRGLEFDPFRLNRSLS